MRLNRIFVFIEFSRNRFWGLLFYCWTLLKNVGITDHAGLKWSALLRFRHGSHLSVPYSASVWHKRSPAGISELIWLRWMFSFAVNCWPAPVVVLQSLLPWIKSYVYLLCRDYLVELISGVGLILMIFRWNSSCLSVVFHIWMLGQQFHADSLKSWEIKNLVVETTPWLISKTKTKEILYTAARKEVSHNLKHSFC